MIYYKRFDLSDVIDVAKSNSSKEFMVFYNWYFNHGVEFQKSVCNICHCLLMWCLSISDITINTAKGADYDCVSRLSRFDAIYLLEHSLIDDC